MWDEREIDNLKFCIILSYSLSNIFLELLNIRNKFNIYEFHFLNFIF